jgi:hypothetical protein
MSNYKGYKEFNRNGKEGEEGKKKHGSKYLFRLRD